GRAELPSWVIQSQIVLWNFHVLHLRRPECLPGTRNGGAVAKVHQLNLLHETSSEMDKRRTGCASHTSIQTPPELFESISDPRSCPRSGFVFLGTPTDSSAVPLATF